MSYYWFNRQELLKEAKEKYDNGGKEVKKRFQSIIETIKMS